MDGRRRPDRRTADVGQPEWQALSDDDSLHSLAAWIGHADGVVDLITGTDPIGRDEAPLGHVRVGSRSQGLDSHEGPERAAADRDRLTRGRLRWLCHRETGQNGQRGAARRGAVTEYLSPHRGEL